jgi:predicted PurR-regulated permease PerM
MSAQHTERRNRKPWPTLLYIWAAASGILALSYALRFAVKTGAAVFAVLLLGILFGLVLIYPIDFLARWLPRGVSTVLTLIAIVGSTTLAIVLSAPFFADQWEWLTEHVPIAVERARDWWGHLTLAGHPLPPGLQTRVTSELGAVMHQSMAIAFGIVSALMSAVAVLALALFIAYDGRGYRRGLLRLVPADYEPVIIGFLNRAGPILQRWLLGQLVSMTVTGVLVGLGLAIVGINSWLVLGALSFVFEFVPYVGPLASALPGIAAALAVSPAKLWPVLIVYGGAHFVEAYMLQPLIMKRAIRLQPALQLIWQVAMGSAFGLLGLFIATPVLACIQVAIEYFYVERKLGKPARADIA